ncbi:MAG: methyltransferase domain-containing protein [Nitrospirae bacterium]|nr:methyltransferase domain-containing protein [Nitrospirota bacterium]
MTHLPQTFSAHLTAFKENQNTPWGKLRYGVGMANIQKHFHTHKAQVLDVGGGTGLDAIPFAKQGYRVTLLDYSEEMIEEAKRSAKEEGVSDRITYHQGDINSIPTLFPNTRFDLILCHNVLQYVEDINTAIKTMSEALKPNGFVSIIAINRYSEPYRLALHQLDLDGALATLDAEMLRTTVFNTDVHARTVGDMHEPLREAGCSVVGDYGIRCVCDYIQDDGIKSDPTFFAKLEKLEYELSRRAPYKNVAKFFQVVAKKEEQNIRG